MSHSVTSIHCFVEKTLNQSLQEMSIPNPHSGGDGREEKVVKMGKNWI